MSIVKVDCRQKIQRLASYLVTSHKKTTFRSVVFAGAGFNSDINGLPNCLNCNLKFENIYKKYISLKDACLFHVNNSPSCYVARECLEELQPKDFIDENIFLPFAKDDKLNCKGESSESGCFSCESLHEFDSRKQECHELLKKGSLDSITESFFDVESESISINHYVEQCKIGFQHSSEVTKEKHLITTCKEAHPKAISSPCKSMNAIINRPFWDFDMLKQINSARLETFDNWPKNSPVSPEVLAQEGFIYLGTGDQTKCVYCLKDSSDWKFGDIPAKGHDKHLPSCNKGLQTETKAIKASMVCTEFDFYNNSARDISNGGLNLLLLRQDFRARLQTFKSWPKQSIIQPGDLARDGFIFLGKEDQTKCVYCLGVLEKWEQGDIPEVEHSKHFPSCFRPLNQECNSTQILKSNYFFSMGQETVAHSSPRYEWDSLVATPKCESDQTSNALNVQETDTQICRIKKRSTKFANLSPEDIIQRIKDLKEENLLLRERKLCKLCLDRNVDTVFLPCGHLASCKDCAPKISNCAICRTTIRGTVLAFIPD